MTKRYWLFDKTPDGSAATQATIVDTPATTQATNFAVGTGNTITFDSTHKHAGVTGLFFNCAGTDLSLVGIPLTPNKKQALSIYRYIGAVTGSTLIFATLRTSSGSALRLAVNSAGKVIIQNSAGATVATSAASITEGRVNRFDVVVDTDTTTTGSCSVSVFNGDATGTPDVTVSATAQNFLGANLEKLYLGVPITTLASQQWFDSLVTDDGATVAPGPYTVANAKPTVLPIANQALAPSTAFSFTAVPSDSDGTITAHEWTVLYSSVTAPTLTGASTATVSGTTNASTAGELVILQYRAQDNLGQWSDPVTVELTTPTSSTTVGFLPGNGAGAAWVNTGGAASIGAALSDASDTTYVESPAYAASASIHWQRYRPMTPGTPGTVVNRHAETATGGTTNFLLAEGDALTIRSTQPLTQSTSIANETDDISAATISDWTKVWGGMSVAT